MKTDTTGRVLVVYYSRTGNTARVARDLARMTHADVEVLADRDHGTGFLATLKAGIDAFRGKPARLGPVKFDPERYALILVGTPVWAGRMSPAIRAYLQTYASKLGHVGLFVTSGNTRASTLVRPVEQVLGHPLDAFIGFDANDLAHAYPNDGKLANFLAAVHGSAASVSVPVAAAG